MSRFATLDSLRKKEAGDEGKQSFYAGGAGESGGRYVRPHWLRWWAVAGVTDVCLPFPRACPAGVSGVNVYGGNRAGGNDQVNKIFDAANKWVVM